MIVTNDDHPLQPMADVVGCYDIRSVVLVVHRAPAFLFPDQPCPLWLFQRQKQPHASRYCIYIIYSYK